MKRFKDLRIGSWNVLSLYRSKSLQMLRVLVAVVEGRKQRGRPKLKWEDGVMEDAGKLEECCKE